MTLKQGKNPKFRLLHTTKGIDSKMPHIQDRARLGDTRDHCHAAACHDHVYLLDPNGLPVVMAHNWVSLFLRTDANFASVRVAMIASCWAQCSEFSSAHSHLFDVRFLIRLHPQTHIEIDHTIIKPISTKLDLKSYNFLIKPHK